MDQPERQVQVIQVQDHSNHHHGDRHDTTHNVHGTANYIHTVAKATLRTNSVTNIEHVERVIYSPQPGNEALLWGSLPRQRDMSGLEANAYMEGSREESVHEILSWAEDPTSELVLYIHAPAGLGKSTLARHLTHRLNAAGRLAASVALSGIPSDARGPESVVKLISREIGEKYGEAIPTILDAIGPCKGAPLEAHVEMYIRDPVHSLGLSHPLAVVFDAVDEWESHKALLRVLPRLASSSALIRFVFLGRSDPNAWGFQEICIRPYPLQPVPATIMTRYFVKEFEDVKWGEGRRPTARRTTQLAELANGLFVWAAVVCSLLQKRLSRLSPDEILDAILDSRRTLGDSERLATLYHQAILWLFPDSEDQDLFRDYLSATLALQEPLPLAEFSSFTDLPIRVINGIQSRLKALQVRMVDGGDGSRMVYPAGRLLHLSFLEYLESISTPPTIAFHIALFDSHSRLAECCLRELPLFLPSSQNLTILDLAPRQRYAVKHLTTHIHRGTSTVKPGAAGEWQRTKHCALLRRFGFGLMAQWRDLYLDLVVPGWGALYSLEGVYADNDAVLVMQDVNLILRKMAKDTVTGSLRISCMEVVTRARSEAPAAWYDLGAAYWDVAETSRSIEACERAVTVFEDALPIVGQTNDFPDWADVLHALGTSLNTRFGLLRNVEDLDRSITQHQRILELRPPGHRARMASLNSLANATVFRFGISGSTSDLDNALRTLREAVELSPPGDSRTSMYLTNLASLLDKRFADTGIVEHHNEAIGFFEEALRLRPPGHFDHVASLDNLATSLYHFGAANSTDGIDEAIRLLREVLELSLFGQADRANSLESLARYLYSRFRTSGSVNDLSEAIHLQRGVLELHPFGHPNRAASLDRLALYLHLRQEKIGSTDDLNESIRLHRQVLELCPPGHSNRPASLNELAWSLVLRHEAQASTEDLGESIQLSRESLDILPTGHPARSFVLDTLARALLHHSGTLEEALHLSRESISLAPSRSPSRWELLMTLAIILHRLYERSGETGQLQEAISTCKEALSLCPTTDPGRPKLTALEAKLAEAQPLKPSLPDSRTPI